jgi:fatty acid desaturase
VSMTVTESAVDREAAFVRQVHHLVRDLMPPRPLVYWTDFLLSIALGYAALAVYLTSPLGSAPTVVCFFIAAALLYRSSVFTHELAHLPERRFRLFRAGWNVLFGVPFLMPSFLYTDHRGHHTRQTYATAGDSEYFPFGRLTLGNFLLRSAGLAVLPFMPVVRFGLLAPLSYLHPALRRLVWRRASSLGGLNPAYRRDDPDRREWWAWHVQEAGCFAVVVTVASLLAAGVIPWEAVLRFYALYLFVMLVNFLRLLGAHRYRNEGEPMTFLEQMLDSTTVPFGPLTEFWGPLGMHYHALHHLIPTLPYHAMGKAHRRLMRELPPGSPYHATISPSLPTAILDLFRGPRDTGTKVSYT